MFRINRRSGEIRVKSLAVQNKQKINVLVYANDGGIVPCSTLTTVVVAVVDTSAPLWERTVYKAQITESAAVFSVVPVSLKAVSINKVVYQLISSDNFLLRHDTGVLQVFEPLDRETTPLHSLTVRATDAVSGMSSDTLLLLEVTDVNDCHPSFLQDTYHVRVEESAEPGTNLLRVTAVDHDKGLNAIVRYSVNHPNFGLDPEDGTLFLRKYLDYEQNKLHQLTVVATDSSTVALTSFVTVIVEVVNTNDNPPVLVNPTAVFTVSQNSPRGSFVGKISARDVDGDSLSYRMLAGLDSVRRAFYIEPTTGIVTVLNPKYFADENEFAIDIAVTDGVFSTRGTIQVRIIPVNNHSPHFESNSYVASLVENLPLGRDLLRVTALDKDLGPYGNISYKLPPQGSSKFFAIDEFTGEITSVKALDREAQADHWLEVEAVDGGGRRGWSKVHVTVIDVNDNRPQFQLPHYYGCVHGNLTTGQHIIRVHAVDADESDAGVVNYSITAVQPPTALEWFTIHPEEGSVHAVRPLHHDAPLVVSLTVRSTDQGSPPLHSDVTVTLSLMSRDHPPSLRYHPSHFVLAADSKPGQFVHRFQATSPEKTEFKIVGGDDYLAVNTSGHLVLKRAPTFVNKTFGLLVQYSKKNFSPCTFTEITITTTGLVATNPIFVEEKVNLNVSESIEVGSQIYKATVMIDDPVTFSILEPVDQLTVDPLTGWLSVSRSLDRESRSAHQLVLVATDSSSSSLTSTCLVLITVTDTNDNPHIFNQDLYNVAVKEDATVGTVLTRLTLTDPDVDGSPVVFYITEGDDSVSFNVTEDQELVVAHPLDRETIAGYTITVAAFDRVFTAFTTVNIVIIDVNDERHRCVHSSYKVSVSEGSSPGHLITSIQTVDLDLESSLSYRISGTGSGSFTVDSYGEVRLKQYLDRETTQGYLLDVAVTDVSHPTWTCSSRVLVVVEDVNDNSPSSTVANETITLTEDATVGLIITKLQVLDFDQGENHKVHFGLTTPSDLFNLSSDSGLLTLARPLQSSPGSVHYVTVKVSDHGVPSLTSYSTLQVIVLGMNDDPPVYVAGSYHVTVPEDAPVGTTLLQVQAFDEGVLTRWNVIYTILEGNHHGEFDIHKRTGELSTCKSLDYEARQAYQLLILATSLGDTSISSYTTVNVTVLDVNDNYPLFKVTRYSVQIREDIDVGQMVLKIDAEDSDSGRNGEIRFSLDEASMRKFSIDPLTGVLMVANHLDRETDGQYSVMVQAADQGRPSLSSTATVNIDVADVNDNPPLFVHPNSTTVIQADRMPGWAVFHFAVTDADQSFTSMPFSFHLIEGNERDMFRIDPDGTLRTTERLKLKLGDLFRVKVRVEDGGSPVLHSSTWIYIKVVEPSKHPPVIYPLRVWLGVYEYQWQGGDLGQINATDLDFYDKLEYSMPTTSPFIIDTRHGMLKARGSLAPGVYSVNVSVTDGKFSALGLVTVTVVPLSQDMLQSSVYIRLSPRTKHERLVTKLPLFLSTLRSAFLRDVTLISVQDIPNSTIGLLIAVSGGADLNVVQEVLLSAGLQGTTPQCDCRNGGLCQRQLQMMPDRTNVFSAAGLSFVTPGHSLSYYCICSIGYAGEHCEEIKCLCPPLQVCVPQRVGFACMPPCSTNQTCPAAMTSSVSWPEILTCLLTFVAVVGAVIGFLIYRRYRDSSEGEGKYGSWGKHNCYITKKAKLSNLKASQKPPIFTGSPNNGTISRNNLEGSSGGPGEGETLPLDYLRNINPLTTKLENDITQGHSSAPHLATCHTPESCGTEDPARDLAALDDQLSQEVVQYGFPPPGGPPPLPQEMEITL